MPETLNKKKFFEETCLGLKCYSIQDSKCVTMYSLEGFWDSVVHAQNVLFDQLVLWNCSKQPSTDNTMKLHSDSGDDIEVVESEALNVQEENVGDEEEVVGNLVGSVCGELPNVETTSQGDVSEEPEDDEKNYHASSENVISKEVTENEVYMDIRLEHNYNHLKISETIEECTHNDEPTVENEIYMDIKLSKTNNGIFGDSNLPVTLVVAKEDEPGVEVLQLNRNRNDLIPSQNSSQNPERMKLLKKKYEDQAPFRYFCNQCSFKTKRHSHMKNHSRFHEKVCTIYSCDQCEFSTIRSSHFQRHLGSHINEVFSCPDCKYTTHSEALLNKHQRYKHINPKKSDKACKPNTFQCLLCAYVTSSEKIFERHMAVHAKKGLSKRPSFKCNHCSYQTPSRSNYYRHLGVHGDERPHMCTTCGLRFKRSDTLVQHQAIHDEKDSEETLFCAECNKRFRSPNALKEHQLTHENGQRFLCEICAASFKTRDNQRRHFNQKHLHGKINTCSICSKTFASKYVLKRHMKMHDHQKTPTKLSDEVDIKNGTLSISTQKIWSNPPAYENSSDVQVIVVQQGSTTSELSVQEGPLFQVASSLAPGQSLSVPVIPVEYAIPTPDTDMEQSNNGCGIKVTASENHVPSTREEIIAVTFVQEDVEFDQDHS